LKDTVTKTNCIDPFILKLVKNIGKKRSLLDNLEVIKTNHEFINISGKDKGNEFYIENEFHKAKGFRKLHVEIAEFSNNLKILHCVFFPDPSFNIPIFGLDLVKTRNIVSAAIVDLSPVSQTAIYDIESLVKNVNKDGFSIIRDVPDWGNIFSNYVLFASLVNQIEENCFYNVVDEYLSILINYSKEIKPDFEKEIIRERVIFQRNYCKQQMKNEKTSSVLLKYFNKNWVDTYIKEVLFDF
tara:strand:+ start:1375 stop:2097 length:723 start_codon:yes stop_codon:yes gene_type:complete